MKHIIHLLAAMFSAPSMAFAGAVAPLVSAEWVKAQGCQKPE